MLIGSGGGAHCRCELRDQRVHAVLRVQEDWAHALGDEAWQPLVRPSSHPSTQSSLHESGWLADCPSASWTARLHPAPLPQKMLSGWKARGRACEERLAEVLVLRDVRQHCRRQLTLIADEDGLAAQAIAAERAGLPSAGAAAAQPTSAEADVTDGGLRAGGCQRRGGGSGGRRPAGNLSPTAPGRRTPLPGRRAEGM